MSVVINGSAGVTTNSGAVYNGISAGTAVASTSGTSIDFTSIPSWVRRITVMFQGVSVSGTSQLLVQLGTSGGIVSSGYVSTGGYMYAAGGTGITSSTAGFCLTGGSTAAYTWSGVVTIVTLGSNSWVSGGNLGNSASTASVFPSGGQLSNAGGTIDRVRITTVNGTDTFDAGSINILYE